MPVLVRGRSREGAGEEEGATKGAEQEGGNEGVLAILECPVCLEVRLNHRQIDNSPSIPVDVRVQDLPV